MFITELFNETKAPKGLLNLVNGDREVVASINDQRIKAVSFVGSTPVAKNVYELSASSGKDVKHLEELKTML